MLILSHFFRYTFTPPIQPDFGTIYTPEETPVPVLPSIIDTCEEFEYIGPDKPVSELATENNITVDEFSAWNNGVLSPWAYYWACVKA